ncbi:MAG: hypothetical protein JWN70_5555 [Planctomycetaceae bacterium]|nr:hypothetical protein [Planctomycetaceae bacterium]
MIRSTLFTTSLAFAIGIVAIQAADPAKSEIDGSWEIIALNYGGKEQKVGSKSKTVSVRENGIQSTSHNGTPRGKNRYTIDPKATPKTITFSDFDKNETTGLGIYELEGDTLKIAILTDTTKKATERPLDLEPGPDKIIATYVRQK